MLDFYNQVLGVVRLFVEWLFSLYILPGVSYGSVILVGMFIWVISLLWPRV